MRGLLAQNLVELPASGEQSVATVFKKIKPKKSLQIFSRQFATMIDAGLSVVGALVILEEQTEDKYLSAIVKRLRADVEVASSSRRHWLATEGLQPALRRDGRGGGGRGNLVRCSTASPSRSRRETMIKRRVKRRDDLPDDGPHDACDPRPGRDADVPRRCS